MYRKNVAGDQPQIDITAFVDPSAVIIGKVFIGANSYIGPGVVIRSDRFSSTDEASGIVIGKNCCIQDIAVIHTHAGTAVTLGDNTIITHGAIIHGPTNIGQMCFIGARSIITNATIGESSYIRSNTIIENVTVAKETFVAYNSIIDSQEKTIALRKITDNEKKFILQCVNENKEYAMRYKYSLTD